MASTTPKVLASTLCAALSASYSNATHSDKMWRRPGLERTEPALGNLTKVRLGESGTIIVGVVGQPPAFRRDLAPPLPPLRLLPQRDSTAQIIAEGVRQILDEDDQVKHKILEYVIGWPDRPAACLRIAADKVLEYVSPAALEEWEHNQSLERDEEERQQAKRDEEKRQKAERNARRRIGNRKRKRTVRKAKPVVGEAEHSAPGRPITETSQRQLRPRPPKRPLAVVEPERFEEPAAKRHAVGGSVSKACVPDGCDEEREEKDEDQDKDQDRDRDWHQDEQVDCSALGTEADLIVVSSDIYEQEKGSGNLPRRGARAGAPSPEGRSSLREVGAGLFSS